MYKLGPVLAAAMCVITASVFAQRQITGKLIDSESRKPVKDALVKIEGTSGETQSNFLGFFQLTIDSADHLLIDSDGYELARIKIPNVNSFQIALDKRLREPETFLVVEQSATFPGGMPAFYKYVATNIRYPADARKKGVSGKVFVEFVIDTTGSIPHKEIRILKGVSQSCDDEVVRLIKGSPSWIPGTQRGKPVRQRLVLPIVFQVDAPFHKDFYSFMSGNTNYPLEARRSGLEGEVLVNFSIDSLGNVTAFNVLNDIGGGCAAEISRVLLNVPPELINALVKESNSVNFTLPVLFGLQKSFPYHKPVHKDDAFLLKPVNITAVSISIESPSQVRESSNSQTVAYDLTRALEKPNGIRKLSLTARGYTSFPLEILTLTKLEFLDLEGNKIKSLPNEIEKLSDLEELYLVENEIESLPDNLRALRKIKVLGLASNRLKSFPDAITSLENLEVLDLSSNGLSDVPRSIGQMKNLRFLAIQGNLIRRFPAEFYQLRKLERLYLRGNPLEAEEVQRLKQHFNKAEIKLD